MDQRDMEYIEAQFAKIQKDLDLILSKVANLADGQKVVLDYLMDVDRKLLGLVAGSEP